MEADKLLAPRVGAAMLDTVMSPATASTTPTTTTTTTAATTTTPSTATAGNTEGASGSVPGTLASQEEPALGSLDVENSLLDGSQLADGHADLMDEDADLPATQKKEKKTSKRPVFSVESLEHPKYGLQAIVDNFPKVFRISKHMSKPGRERQDLGRLLRLYQEWGYFMFPREYFENLLKRTEGFGSKRRTKQLLDKLRNYAQEKLYGVERDDAATGYDDGMNV